MCSVLHLQITSAHVHTRLVKANVVLHFDCGLHVCTHVLVSVKHCQEQQSTPV